MLHSLPAADLQFLDHAPLRKQLTRNIHGPPHLVFDVLADGEQWPRWFPFFRHCRTDGRDSAGVPMGRIVDAGLLQAREEFIEWQPGQSWHFTLTACSTRLIARMAEGACLYPAPGGSTRLIWRSGLELKPAARLLLPLVSVSLDLLIRYLLRCLEQEVRRRGSASKA